MPSVTVLPEWHALEAHRHALGAPDLRAVPWSSGRYDVRTLSNVYTADHFFVRRVAQEVAGFTAANETGRDLMGVGDRPARRR